MLPRLSANMHVLQKHVSLSFRVRWWIRCAHEQSSSVYFWEWRRGLEVRGLEKCKSIFQVDIFLKQKAAQRDNMYVAQQRAVMILKKKKKKKGLRSCSVLVVTHNTTLRGDVEPDLTFSSMQKEQREILEAVVTPLFNDMEIIDFVCGFF